MFSIDSLVEDQFHRKSAGTFSYLCPECSEERSHGNKNNKCLRVTFEHDQAVWFCHNCGEKGQKFMSTGSELPKPNGVSNGKSTAHLPSYSSASTEFLSMISSDRGIDFDGITDEFKSSLLSSDDIYFNRLGRKGNAIGFDYGKGCIKWRATDSKDFSQTGVCRTLFPEAKDLSGKVVIVEGEYDAISMRSCGYTAFSVPSGASISGSSPPDFLKPLIVALSDRSIEVIIAVDADEKGKELCSKLVDFLGRKKVGVLDWSKYGVKDANEALVTHGPPVMHTAISEVGNVLYEGIIRASTVALSISEIRSDGFKSGAKVGLNSIDNLYTVCPDQISVVTGFPGSGKSELVDYFMISLSQKEDWKFAVFSAENPVEIHAGKLLEKYSGKPIFEGDSKIGDEDLNQASEWLDEHFFFLDSSSSHTIDSILTRTEILIEHESVNGLLIDPFNYTDVALETDAISEMLTKLHSFAKKFHIHIWIVAHPQKMYRGEGGKIPVPNGGDISGSAAWWAKADFGLTVSRDEKDETILTVWKCRFKWLGEVGSAALSYDRTCGRYGDGESSSDIADSLASIDWGDAIDVDKQEEKTSKQDPLCIEDWLSEQI